MKFTEHTKQNKLLGKALVCGFVMAVIASFFPFAAACGGLPENVVRLHVVANSDSEEDQSVKLLVRDAVLEEAAKWYGGAQSMEEASSQLCTHLQSLGETARTTLAENGMEYSAKVEMTEMYFSTRDYGVPAACGTLPDTAGDPWGRPRKKLVVCGVPFLVPACRRGRAVGPAPFSAGIGAGDRGKPRAVSSKI